MRVGLDVDFDMFVVVGLRLLLVACVWFCACWCFVSALLECGLLCLLGVYCLLLVWVWCYACIVNSVG